MVSAAENRIKSVLISEESLKERVCEYGKILSRDYEGRRLLIVGVLKGSFVFMSDLIRSIEIPCEVDFVCASSYGNDTVSSGELNITKDVSVDISEYDVLLTEDILDTGNTLSKLKRLFESRNPKSLKIIALLDKPSRRIAEIEADYVLFTIEDKFVVGYGLDYAEKYRNLRYIGEL